MIESNINIVSNVYIRNKELKFNKDKKYIEKITGAERLKEIRKHCVGLEAVTLTEVQENIITQNRTCINSKSGEKTHGSVMRDGVLYWENRCEYMECEGHGGCLPKIIPREMITEEEPEKEESLEKLLERHGISIKDDTPVFKKDKNKEVTVEPPEEHTAPAELPAEEIQQISNRYEKISTPDPIINAPLDSHIILNSGPGTGKTYTITQRLIHILENGDCNADEIYILCYTRSARKVIEDKLRQAVNEERISPSALNIPILTFDSYAAYFLNAMKEQGIIEENFENCDYNGRIKLFNKYISAEDFEDIRYFIVDEIQDLVNERAKMVLKILENLKCGYLLAGDRCQAIYDYDADNGDDKISSIEFYDRAEKQFPEDMRRYEITVNHRQTPQLAEKAAQMREVLLTKNIYEQNKYANDVISEYSEMTKIKHYIKTLSEAPAVPTAILCRNNAEAEYISSLLCKKGIVHTLNRGANNARPLSRWIADVFWDYCLDNKPMSKNTFMRRVSFRTDIDNERSEMLWEFLCRLTDSREYELNISELRAKLTNPNDLPQAFFDEPPMLTVSTIHKAKGSEFERVILIDSDSKPSSVSAEEARVRYVALTRPKSDLEVMKMGKKIYFKRTSPGRTIETGYSKTYGKNTYCSSITIGLTGDIDTCSFVTGDFETALDRQEYILKNVKMYDKLTARRSAPGSYEIFHNTDHCIGCLSKEMVKELQQGVNATGCKYNLPDNLEELYVSGITTEVLRQACKDIPQEFQESKICFGISVTGFARLIFNGKKK